MFDLRYPVEIVFPLQERINYLEKSIEKMKAGIQDGTWKDDIPGGMLIDAECEVEELKASIQRMNGGFK